ncbi:hypothetical protein [Calothrix sp. 336/3]|uniref:hypothetical protein n=1 Tax=Calothrix sp. 336/3 TaxID=1337936 RepID=UPI0004E45D41|nr:hypothetical protein [Calothrix sp. 336/3]AKG20284.1 hypothetical protein IJ00_02215 [Calothrix sp. 336/3]
MTNPQLGSWKQVLISVLVAILVLLTLNSFIMINLGEARVLSVLGQATDGTLLKGFHIKPPLISQVDVYTELVSV